MLSPVFWLSLIAVFWGMKWLAEGLIALATVELRRVEPVRAEVIEPSVWRQATPAELDEAA